MNHEEHIKIGTDRHITVPESLRRIAVQYDHNVETVTFDCPRYWDNNDMSEMTVYINYIRKDRVRGQFEAKNVKIDEKDPNIMHFDWTVSRNASECKGELRFLVCIVKTDSKGNELRHWNAELCNQMYVTEGLECNDFIGELHADIITDLLLRMDNILIANGTIIDKSLTEPGLAADAKATGDRIRTYTESTNKHLEDLDANKANLSALAAEISERKNSDAVLKSRMDAFTSLKPGGTVGDAELRDIRIGANGVTYASAGDAVRSQLSNINEDLSNNKNVYHQKDAVATPNSMTFVDFEIVAGKKYLFISSGTTGKQVAITTYEEHDVPSRVERVTEGLNLGETLEWTASANAKVVGIYAPEKVSANIRIVCRDTYVEYFRDQIGDLEDDILPVSKTYERVLNTWANISYGTNVLPGEMVTVVGSNTGFHACVIPCMTGDRFKVYGQGGAKYRLWAFVNNDWTLVSNEEASVASSSGTIVIAKQDGYLIVQAAAESGIEKKVIMLESAVDIQLKSIRDEANQKIVSELGTDGVVKYTGTGLNMIPYNFKAGETYLFTNTSTEPEVRINAFIRRDDNSENLQQFANALPTGKSTVFTAAVDGATLRFFIDGNGSFKLQRTCEDAVMDRVTKLEIAEKSVATPMVKFTYEKGLKEPDTPLVDFSNKGTYMDQIYKLFDGLVEDYPDYVNRIDVADSFGLGYPAYASGYKTYMYNFTCHNEYVEMNEQVAKKKLLIIGGVHGNEYAAPYNLYEFANELCSGFLEDPDIFKLRSAFNIHIVPCVNGYGLIHGTRGNGNKVNINRNYPVKEWTMNGEETMDDQYSNNYSGPSAGSEFETQLITRLTEALAPDIAIDHHNYGEECAWQFYVECGGTELLRLAHQSLVDCSREFKRTYPEYFGTGFGLVQNKSGSAPGTDTYADLETGTSTRWWHQNGVSTAATIEVSHAINYSNGAYVGGVGKGIDQFGPKTFSVAEYTLRNVLCRFAQRELERPFYHDQP
jgi:hypothetical protein